MSASIEQPRRMTPTVLAVGVSQIIGWGFTFNLPGVIGPSIAESFHTSLNIIMLGPTVMLVLLAISSWWIGPLFERFGAQRLMVVGAMLMAIGLALMTWAPIIHVYIGAWVLFGIGGAASLSTAAQIALADVFGDQARQAISAMSLISGLSNTILWPFLSRLDTNLGWRSTTMLGALMLLLIYIPLISRIRNRNGNPNSEVNNQTPDTDQHIDGRKFALVATATSLSGFITWGFSLTLIPLFIEKGLSNNQAVTLASALGLISVSARLLDTLKGMSPLRSAIASILGMLFAFILLFWGASVLVAGAFILCYGLSAGLMSIVRATLPLEIFPRQAYALASAKLALPMNLAFAAAPPIYAWIIAHQGANYALMLSISLAAAAATSLVVLWNSLRNPGTA